MKNLVGIVEEIAFTNGGAGNQWTTISGVRYATWWNILSIDWRVGDRVKFQAYRGPLWHGQPDVDCAKNIERDAP